MAMSPNQGGDDLPNAQLPNNVNHRPKPNEGLNNDSGLSVSPAANTSSSSEDSDSEGPQMPPTNDRENSLARQREDIKNKSQTLSLFIINYNLNPSRVRPNDEVEATLLRCTNAMVRKHEILFNSMMRKLEISNETAYSAFINVVNQLFEVESDEPENSAVSWNRIIAFYAFGGQLALFCKNNNLTDCQIIIPRYLAQYAKDVLTNFILENGGWRKLCEEHPAEDEIDNKVWKVLTWTAVGLGLATTAAFFASNR